VAEPAPADDQRRGVVTGSLGVVLAERGQPVPGAPFRGVGRVDDDHGQAGVRGHLHEAAAELPGWDARDCAAEPAAPPPPGGAVPGPLAAFGAGVGEVEVLDHDRPRAVVPGGGDEAADGVPESPVACRGGQAGQAERDRAGGARHVPVRGDHRDGQVAGVHVDRHDRVVPELVQCRRRGTGGLPAGIEVPPPGCGAVGEVVPDSAGGGLGGGLVAPVGERYRARQAVSSVRPVRQVP
jgi:hypothetical protein